MAENRPEVSAKKQKRKLRAAPTLREQAVATAAKSNKKNDSRIKRLKNGKVSAPFRALGRLVAKVWNSKVFRPIRFIVRILGRILVPRYLRNSFAELKLVTWPDFKTTWRLTFAVIVFGVVFGLAITGVDIVFEKIFREVLLG